MHRLSDDAQAILDIARDTDNPSDRDRRRLTGAMAVQLGAAAMVSSTTMGAAASAAGASTAAAGGIGSAVTGAGIMTKVLASVALVGAISGGVAVHRTRAPMHDDTLVNSSTSIEATSPPPPCPVAPEIASTATPDVATAAAPEIARTAAPVAAPRAKPRLDIGTPSRQREPAPSLDATSTANALAREVSVLGSARSALRDHEPARALALLDANRATFAHGMLREEFLAARVFALRDLGRTVEADAAAAQFAAEMPHSPLAAELTGSQEVRGSNGTHEN